MARSESSGLYSPVSVTKELWPWCLWAICLLTVVWTALVAWFEISSDKRSGILETTIAVGSGASVSVPLIVIYSILIVVVGNFILGGGIMVTARATKEYLYNKIEKQREKLREQGRAQGIEQGRAQGIEQGRAQGREEGRAQGRAQGREEGREQGRMDLAAKVEAWNARRLDAEARGEPFDEPPPVA